MADTNKPTEDKTVSDKPVPVKKDPTELSDAEMKEVSGGPTAVEMPGRFTTIGSSLHVTTIGNATGGAGAG